MSKSHGQRWFRARLRWAVMKRGRGLVYWKDGEHIFLSDNRETAIQHVLRLGYGAEQTLSLDCDASSVIEYRFAKLVYVKEMGSAVTAFEIDLGETVAMEGIDCEHVFNPVDSFRKQFDDPRSCCRPNVCGQYRF